MNLVVNILINVIMVAVVLVVLILKGSIMTTAQRDLLIIFGMGLAPMLNTMMYFYYRNLKKGGR